MLTAVMPVFSIPLSLLIIPTLIMSEVIGKVVVNKILSYSESYAATFQRHLQTETEIQLQNGRLTEASHQILAKLEFEMELLQYKENLLGILTPWADQVTGQPVFPVVNNITLDRIEEILSIFHTYILEIQVNSLKCFRNTNNALCRKVCTTKTRIVNLTSFPLPSSIEKLFADGPNSVPHEAKNIKDLKESVESDLIKAAVSFFRSHNSFYPKVDKTDGLKLVIKQLICQSSSNSKSVSFFCKLYENYIENIAEFEKTLSPQHFENTPDLSNMLPHGTILSLADKGLGLVLLPIDWYIKEYKVQSIKGGHIQTQLSSDQCLVLLTEAIQSFRSSLETEERKFLSDVFVKPFSRASIGTLKLVAKIHKVDKLDISVLDDIPSRPIRGAENCPINPYSKSLCKLLQNLHTQVKIRMGETYPIILGCDEYSNKIRKIEYPASQWTLNTILSADFADAYTKSNLEDLQGALKTLGEFTDWPVGKVELCKKLAKLVFENCYFETPNGIQRQSNGFPMGGHCSREGLDTILLSCELQLLQDHNIRSSLYYYCRLVDDISTITNGKFQVVRNLVQKMADVYPSTMPLNIQLSFGYSHFLDSHVFNMYQSSDTNKITTSLAYKPLSRFEYVPFSSNIAPKYKGKHIRYFTKSTTQIVFCFVFKAA